MKHDLQEKQTLKDAVVNIATSNKGILQSFVLISLVFLIPATARAYSYPVDEIKTIEDVKKITALKENEIDIGWLALVFAKESFYPELDIGRYNKLLDIMALDIKLNLKSIGRDDSDARVRVMNTYFFKVIKFQYDKSDIHGRKKSNRTINGLMDTNKGSCWSMPLLYLSVAQRLGYPVYPVSAPQHIFLRYEDPKLEWKNIEATNGGYSSDEEYIYVFEIPEKGIKSGAYMKTLTYLEFLGEIIAENGRYWGTHGNLGKARQYLELALELQPTGAEIARSLAATYYLLDKEYSGFNMVNYRNIARYYLDKAYELGVAELAADNYEKHQKELQNEYLEGRNKK